MAFLGNLMQSFFSQKVPLEDEVMEVPISCFNRVPVVAREDSLVLYGPTNTNKYELLLHKPVEDSCTSAYSLFRIPSIEDAQIRFINLKNVLVPLTEVIPHEINVCTIKKICEVTRQNPTWNVAHVAAHFGFVQAFANSYIASKADMSELDFHMTPLHLALQAEDMKMIKTLLGLNVSVDVTDTGGNSVYHTAASTNENVIKLITCRKSKLLNSQNNEGKTPLHLACEADKPDCVKALLIAGADVNVAATHSASLPIHSAIQSDSTLCAKEIITMYPDQLYKEDMKHGGTPLHWATSRQMINALVDLGCKINAGNFQGATALHNMVLHNRLSCAVALLSWGAEVNLKDNYGNTPLHLVSDPSVLQALLSFGAETSICNNKGELCRHAVATSTYAKKNSMLYILHAVGASRCSSRTATCTDGCSPDRKYDGEPPQVMTISRPRTLFDEFLDEELWCSLASSISQKKGERVLCLDGGGIKGLVMIQLLRIIHKESGKQPNHLFDWICGTSTGGILALALALGKTPNYCQGLYFKLKDEVFIGQRPYSEKPLEQILKREFGESTCMTDIKGVKVIVTGVLADRFPADLHLFRNYINGEDSFYNKQNISASPLFTPTHPPSEQLVWQAARASGAAPSYFSAYGRFIDGGLIANNPTLDFLTEITEYNVTLRAMGREREAEQVKVVVSLGTGLPPVSKVNAIDVFRPESLFKTIQMAFGLSNMAKLLIDQATMADNRTVDRARAWCHTCGISYFRLSPQLSQDVQLDETRDDVLVNMLWETLVYANSKMDKIKRILALLERETCPENSDIMVVD